MSEARIYIADLAAYNEGDLVGEWFAPADFADAADFAEAVQSYITALPHPEWAGPREEWAIHDFEGFGPLRLSEYESLEKVHELAAGIDEYGEAYAVYVSGGYEGSDFQEAYAGEWGSEVDFAQELADDLGMIDANASWPYSYIDWESATRDLFIGDYWSEKSDHGVYVFRSI